MANAFAVDSGYMNFYHSPAIAPFKVIQTYTVASIPPHSPVPEARAAVRAGIRRVLEAMGPDRVRMGMEAFKGWAGNRGDWDDCFMGQAMRETADYHPETFTIAWILKVDANDICFLINAFDGCSCGRCLHPNDLREMAMAYLAEHGVVVLVPSVVTDVDAIAPEFSQAIEAVIAPEFIPENTLLLAANSV